MKRKIFQMSVELTNHKWSSALIKRFTMSRLSKPFIPLFIKTYKINVEEAVRPYAEHKSLHSFFTRQIKMAKRPIDQSAKSVVSPVDGRCEETGTINEETSFVVKGQTYKIGEMLQSKEKASDYNGGMYVILYLSPRDYHRIHSPFNCVCTETVSLGDRSYPVNETGLKYGVKPLSHNYRTVNYLQAENVTTAMIEVGAMNINTIVRTKSDPQWTKGEEVGYFSFGSTVILLFKKDTFTLELSSNKVKVGERIGLLHIEKPPLDIK
ncbi:phosphatidylserine decarboxylase [Shouchella lehensis]|nr:phosphatidylserine decarboxylase [Shouchella lehensis]